MAVSVNSVTSRARHATGHNEMSDVFNRVGYAFCTCVQTLRGHLIDAIQHCANMSNLWQTSCPRLPAVSFVPSASNHDRQKYPAVKGA